MSFYNKLIESLEDNKILINEDHELYAIDELEGYIILNVKIIDLTRKRQKESKRVLSRY